MFYCILHFARTKFMIWYCPFVIENKVDVSFLSFFLAPPAERQRSFSNAELSVVRRRHPSSVVVNFSLKIFISQKRGFLFIERVINLI